MNKAQLPVLILLIFLSTAVIIALLKNKKKRVHTIVLAATGLALTFSLVLLIYVLEEGSFYYNFGNWNSKIGIEFFIGEYASIFTFALILIAGLILIFSLKDLDHEVADNKIGNYYTLVMLLVFSMIGMIFTNDLFNMYVFMEILSLTSCGIISIKNTKETTMATFKYLMLGAIGSISILLGIAMLYMVTGQLNMTATNQTISLIWQEYPRNLLISLSFILTGLGLKAAIFPLHVWLPDAHSNAPSPSSALLSGLVLKIYAFAMVKILFRVIGIDIIKAITINNYLAYFAVLSIIMGSVFAIGQKDIKRLLAYSSVSQIGYVFLGIGLATEAGLSASLYHIIAHAMMKTALFLSAGAIIYQTGIRDVREMDGIGYRMPITMATFTIAALGMIGIPGIKGFMSKWYLGLASFNAGKPIFIIFLLASSFLNAIYFLPIIISAYLKECDYCPNVMTPDLIPFSMKLPLLTLSFLCIVTGLFPNMIMNVVQKALPSIISFVP